MAKSDKTIPVKKLITRKNGTKYVGTVYINPTDYQALDRKTKITSKQEHTDKAGRYLPKRAKEHVQIINKYVNSAPKPKDGQKPKVILLLGGAASGKSFVVKKILQPQYGDDFGTVNVDDIKADLGGGKDFNNYSMQDVMTAANRVHEESYDVGKTLTNEIIRQKRNFIYDGTLSNANSAKELIGQLKGAGYDVKLVGVTIDTKEAYERARFRALGNIEEGGKKDGSGRYVPDKVLIDAHIGSTKTFEEVKDLVDEYELYDNNVERGEDPRKIIVKNEVVDEALYANFKKKALDSSANYLAPTLVKKAIDFIKGLVSSEEEYYPLDISRMRISNGIEIVNFLIEKAEFEKKIFDMKSEDFDALIKSNPSQEITSRILDTVSSFEEKFYTSRAELIKAIRDSENDFNEYIEDHKQLLKATILEPTIFRGDFKYRRLMADSLGRTRETLPQIDSNNIDDVIIHFAQKSPDSKVSKKNLKISDIKFCQNEINEEKVIDLMDKVDFDDIQNRFLVAGNKKAGFYLIDGHHRVSALAEIREDGEVPCYVIDLDPKEAIRRLNLMKFTTKIDINKSELIAAFELIKKAFNNNQASLEEYSEAKSIIDKIGITDKEIIADSE